ncbi:hypothetical protein [Ilyobacter polytropus]|uniref:Uncharacterized protein n=1 Tax=Ilyobacter polytropus (strain ATCC 51220 / DSM 2926 / LMG 16218 / CuHBu1) TaxID=572544 RepID=E3H7F9_ILYPC|nr:hypothetical protein [Ilyobacter polytropus]ADO82855.1 hypothetical protein Ilyop_1074 [Ilyobacter polytropus DSM 2926]
MDRVKSRELAFFNLLKSLISPNIKNESIDYVVSIDDLQQKMHMDRQIISSFIKKLQEDGLVDILEQTDTRINVHFERTHEKLLEFISLDEVESTIIDIKEFIGRNLKFFNFTTSEEYTKKYAEEALKGMEKYGENFDMTDIIEKGVNDVFNKEEVMVRINEILFAICENAEEKDLNILESIIYCSLNLPVVENPFYITLFLTKLCFEIEFLKRS